MSATSSAPPDLAPLWRALALAEFSIGLSDPNPRVGCVIHDAQGRPVAEGFTQQAGGPHAEAMALRQAQADGRSVHGGTAWVTLEPCAHHGRTPPCADALIAAGLRRVVVACRDPFPLVAGQGIARLRAAGIEVQLADDAALVRAAQRLNIGFFSRVQRGRPWVRLKVAASLDGRTALPDGRSQWITGEAARADGHAWRRRAGALLTGIGTALDDDPRLDVRLVPTQHQPLRVVVDSALRLPPQARLLQPPGQALVVSAAAPPDRVAALTGAGAELLTLGTPDGRVDLPALLVRLAERGINELHVEAGARLNGALLGAGLVDELLVYLAPTLLGTGRGMADLPALPTLSAATRWTFIDSTPVVDDLRLRALMPGSEDFLGQ